MRLSIFYKSAFFTLAIRAPIYIVYTRNANIKCATVCELSHENRYMSQHQYVILISYLLASI